MQRITIAIDDDLLETIDKISAQRGYASRSETLRDLVRDAVTHAQPTIDGDAKCYTARTYVYQHETRDLSRRLTMAKHDHHDLSVSTLHVHIDGHDCLEVSVLKGKAGEIQTFADSVVTQRGVRFGDLHLIPSELGPHHAEPHSHD
ncbi:nickel-responsive transcriptional regulator NikR [Rhizobium freirei]|uniref:nickel-responsive transcriptional regulator NikR n=1 Tax=Rhizobium freirei TaxID=1353277 RepID=UPI00055C4B04|nr:nickel-responsive transcriptional regulator NikR [Rhizobium freirei]